MRGNTELEEGEAFCYKDDDDNIDLDSLSYIGERIQQVLGDCQKDFEGVVTAEKLGAKFGDYGSFLPTCERFPPFQSHPKTPQRHYSSPKSTRNLHMVAALHNSKAPSNMAPSARLGTASNNAHPFDHLRAYSVDHSVKKNTGICSNAVMEKSTLKDDCETKSESLTDQRKLKFRIKVKPDTVAKKNAAIYSGLGLDNSPSSSMGNSPEESEDVPLVSQEIPEESPTGIVQVMTSFSIPGGVLISPLHDSLLNLTRMEKVIGDGGPVSSVSGHQEHYSMSTDESDFFVGDRHLLKKRKVSTAGISEKQHMNGICSENDMTLHIKKRLENRTPDVKDFLSNDLKCTPLSSSICDAGEIAEFTGKAFEVSKKFNKDGVECRMASIEAAKEDSLESISGQDREKIEKKNTGNSFMKKDSEHKPGISRNTNSTDLKNNGKFNASMISEKAEADAVKCKVAQDTQKHETNQKGKVKSESENKSKRQQNPGKIMTAAEKDNVGPSNDAIVTNKKSAGAGVSSKNKMHKIKPMKDNKIRGCDRDLLKGKKSGRKVDGIVPADGPSVNKDTLNANLDNVEKKSAYRVKVKERPSGNKLVNQLLVGPCVKYAPGAFPIAENQPTLEMEPLPPPPPAAAPQLIEEDWVCCDSCQKWRLLPMGLKPEQLPEKWLCSMLYWLPGMNRCNISEEDTTKALYSLYQMPISEGQNNIQSHATGPDVGANSVDTLQFGLNRKESDSDVIFDRGKKHRTKEKTKSGTNNNMHQMSSTVKNNARQSGKNKRLIEKNQQSVNASIMKNSGSKHLSRLNNLIEKKNFSKEIEEKMSGGDRNHVKLKRKMEANQYRSGTPKKSKIEDVCYADTNLNPGVDFEKVGRKSRNCLPTKVSVKNMKKRDGYCLSEDVQDKLVVPVKKGDQAQFSSDDGSMNITDRHSSKTGSIKKSKMSDWVDNEKRNNMLSLQGDMQCSEEDNVSGVRKEKKYTVLNTVAKSENGGDDKLSRESGMNQVFLSDSSDQIAAGTKVKSIDKAQQSRKLRRKVASYQSLDCFDPLGNDTSARKLSLAATSSSSKVSGSHKARTNLEDVRDSPVESVTSSPLKTSYFNKCILAAEDTSAKDDTRKGGLSSMSSRKNVDSREGKLSVKMRERNSYDLHPAPHVNCGNSSRHEEKMNKNNQENARSWQMSGKVTSLRVKEKDISSCSEVSRDKMKVSASENGFSKIGASYESVLDSSYHASGAKTRNYIKSSSPKSKHNFDDLSKTNSSRHWLSETGKQTELKQKDVGNSVLKMDAPCSNNRKIISQQNLIQNFEAKNQANLLCAESRDGKTKVLSSSDGEARYRGSKTALGLQKGDMSNGDITNSVRNSVDVSCKVGVNCSSGNFAPDGQLTESSLMTNSRQIAFNILEEATKLKDSADHYKNSGFQFESNETYFKAALKFLHGASLLGNCYGESSEHGDPNQMQIYAATAKLFESCAHKYERRQEMATATLAYKCMEVVYMRLVYCKNSSINRERHELQSTLQMVSQGESPSSSASDIDNLSNLAVVDKATFPRGTNAYVANSQVISARKSPNIVRLLDFTRDISLAMEASRKWQSTLKAANFNMEEARNRECMTSIRKVVDFSFQDIDELVQLVLIATKAITRAGLGGARD